jgi:hypothetical protein
MAGIQDPQPLSISTLGQPLVSPLDPAATPQVVALDQQINQQAQASSAGLIQAIQNAPVAAAQRQLALQQAAETLDPNAVAAREAQVQAAAATAAATTAQANLATKPPGTADLIALHIKYHGVPVRGTNGMPDLDATAESGAACWRAENQLQYALKGLQATPQVFWENGQQRSRLVNGFGDNLTPGPDGSNPVREKFEKMRDSAASTLFGSPDYSGNTPGQLNPTPETGAAPGAPTLSAADVAPATPPVSAYPAWAAAQQPALAAPVDPSQARAWLLNAGVNPATMSDTDAVEAYQSLQSRVASAVVPLAPPAAAPAVAPITTVSSQPTATGGHTTTISVEPKPAPGIPMAQRPVVSPWGPSFLAAPMPGTDPKSQVMNLKNPENEAYHTWNKSKGEIAEVRSLAADPEYAGKTPAQQNATDLNPFDLRLKAAVSAMTNPQTAEGRSGYKMMELELKQPYVQKYVQNIREALTGTGTLTPQSRAALLTAAQRIGQAKEATAAPQVRNTVQSLARMGVSQDSMRALGLDDEDLALGMAAPADAAPPTPPTPPRTTTVGGKTYYMKTW